MKKRILASALIVMAVVYANANECGEAVSAAEAVLEVCRSIDRQSEAYTSCASIYKDRKSKADAKCSKHKRTAVEPGLQWITREDTKRANEMNFGKDSNKCKQVCKTTRLLGELTTVCEDQCN